MEVVPEEFNSLPILSSWSKAARQNPSTVLETAALQSMRLDHHITASTYEDHLKERVSASALLSLFSARNCGLL
jgi:hypothetical protein